MTTMASLSRLRLLFAGKLRKTDEPVVAGNPRELQERLRQLVRARERGDLRRAPERREHEAVARGNHAPAPSADPCAEAFEVQPANVLPLRTRPSAQQIGRDRDHADQVPGAARDGRHHRRQRERVESVPAGSSRTVTVKPSNQFVRLARPLKRTS